MLPSRAFPPVEFCLGTNPSQAANWRPDLNIAASGTLAAIAEGRIDVAPLVTSRIGVGDVPAAFEELANPEGQAKILVEPWR